VEVAIYAEVARKEADQAEAATTITTTNLIYRDELKTSCNSNIRHGRPLCDVVWASQASSRNPRHRLLPSDVAREKTSQSMNDVM
jgi:hypothetical protein